MPYCARPYTGISRNADSRVEHRAAWVREASGRRRRSAGSPGSVRRCDEDGGPQGSGGRGAARVMRAARLTPPRVRAGLPCATRSRVDRANPDVSGVWGLLARERRRVVQPAGRPSADSSFPNAQERYSSLISAGIGPRGRVGAHSFSVRGYAARVARRRPKNNDRSRPALRCGAADGFRSGRWFCVRPCAAERFSAQRRVSWPRPRPRPARGPRPR